MEVQRADGSVISLPDNILFQIFVKLGMKDLCRCSLVCQSWKTLSQDPVLWRFLDLRRYPLSIDQVQRLLASRCSDSLRTLAVQGLNLEPSSISDSFFSFLSASFSNLALLHLEDFNLTFISLSTFPPSLKKLGLVSCIFPHEFFDKLKTDNIFPKLEYLDVSMNAGLTDHHMERISYIKSLKTLIMKQNRNHEVTDIGAKHLSKLKNINSLDITNTGITDQGVDYMVTGLPKLRRLNLSMLKLSNLTITALGNYSRDLEKLILNQVFGVSDIMPLVNLPHISYININNTSVERETVMSFRLQNPNCLIDFKSENYLKSRQGMTVTVNDGRFCI